MGAKLENQISFLKSLDRAEVREAVTCLAEYLNKLKSTTANEKPYLLKKNHPQ
jgi:hypothetical protein